MTSDGNSTSTGSFTQQLAARCMAIDPDDFSPAVWDKISLCLLDAFGACLTARSQPWSQQAVRWVERLGAVPEATVIGSSVRSAASEAAFANGVMAHAMLLEDMHTDSKSHVGVVAIPAALALAEVQKATGRDFAAAVVAGYEAVGRLGRAIVNPAFVKNFRPTGIFGPFGAAASAVRLLGLDTKTMVNAFGLAGNLGSGLNEWAFAQGSEVYFHAGVAARGGIMAAALAADGALAPVTIVEGEGGMFAAYGTGRATKETSEALEILSVYYKPAPACSFAQTACQAALAVSQTHVLDPAAIAGIRLHSFRQAIENPGCDNPGPYNSVTAARMSLQFSVGAVLAHGRLGEANYARLDDPDTLRLGRMIELVEVPEFTQAFPPREGAEIEVTLRNGRILRHRMAEMAPLEADAIRARFRDAAGAALGPYQAAEIEEMVGSLRDLADAATLARLLVPAT